MDPFEPIFLDNGSGIKPKTFIYTDVIDDDSINVDMTWSSYKIDSELRSITQKQFIPTNIGTAGQILAMNAGSNSTWMDLDEIVHFVTNDEIDTIFSHPSSIFRTLTLIDGNGIAYMISNLNTSLANKVDKVQGKGLSDNNFENTHKQTIDKIISGSYVTASAGTLFIDRTISGGGI